MAERNINFNEAKKLGLVAPNKIAEKQTLQAAGGESAFRPESWWNQQLNKQVNSKDFKEIIGFRSNSAANTNMHGGLYGVQNPIVKGPEGQTEAYTEKVFRQNQFGVPKYQTVTYNPVYEDATINVLKAITAQSKGQVEQAQRTSGEMKARNRRMSRVTGGLLAGVQTPGASAITTGPQLGVDDALGNDSLLGRRTRI
jgi:hypothetical protein